MNEEQMESNLREQNALSACMSRWPTATFLTGIGVGAGLMYIFDFKLGHSRRTYLGQQIKAKVNDLEEAATTTARKIGTRAKSAVAHARSAFSKTGKDELSLPPPPSEVKRHAA